MIPQKILCPLLEYFWEQIGSNGANWEMFKINISVGEKRGCEDTFLTIFDGGSFLIVLHWGEQLEFANMIFLDTT